MGGPIFIERNTNLQEEFKKVKKPIKVLVACNTLTQIQGEIYQDHSRFFYRLGKDFPKIEFHNIFSRRVSIDRFRNYAAQTAVQLGCDYLFFIDDDMKIPVDCFKKLYMAVKQYKIIAALNYIRGYPFKPMAFVEIREGIGKHVEPAPEEMISDFVNRGAILDCAAIGTAVCLIDVSLFKTTPGPWFVTGPHSTEDIYFCYKAKELNPKLKIGTHCGILTGHQLEPEFISYHNRDRLLKYEESYMTEDEVEMIRKGDRGSGYIRANVDPILEKLHASINTKPE